MALTIIQARSSDYDERFGFETSGSFYCAYSTEKFYIVLISLLAIGGCVGIYFGLMASFPKDQEVAIFLALALLVCWAICLFVCYIAFRLVIKGSQYHYKADEAKLTVFHGSQTQDFFYMNIMNVRYEPLMLIKKQRGFLITVVTRKGTHIFKYIYNNYNAHMTPENTPFYILEERAGLIQKADPDLYFKRKRETQLMEEAVIENGELERPVKYDERLHPAPAVDIKPLNEDKIVIAKGTFTIAHELSRIILFPIITAICAILIFILTFEAQRATVMILGIGYSVLRLPLLLIVIVCTYLLLHYRRYSYESDNLEFRITDPKGNCDVIYYIDVTEVKYSPLKQLGVQRGYKVEIITKYRTVTYNWLFLKSKKFQETSETPFRIIEEHINK